MKQVAVGFHAQIETHDLNHFRTLVAAHLHDQFVGHAASGEWRMWWMPRRLIEIDDDGATESVDGVDLVLGLPSTGLTDDALIDLVEILSVHGLSPLDDDDLERAVDTMEAAAAADHFTADYPAGGPYDK
ncbi:hypothetical protein GOEFS_119_00280 [Gordonia effusa NBRC 100432]|uniref:Uncharacterized protein n=1 Tax=Gordonia effusa NBRC 100432 TaxID=1077974 RepID=H0R637_9ACTN|nr:hypothetical protein [Gordonia effusa]GAB20538.1 hypothetical protein GOEFS_119_00280 [Gordonia effusa NBRC 100432]